MEVSPSQPFLLWNLLRVISAGLAAATSLLVLVIMPSVWWIITVPVFFVVVISSSLAVAQWKIMWIWLTLVAQIFLFASALFSAVFGIIGEEFVPVLLLAFTMILASEHILTSSLKYSAQFSRSGNRTAAGFNAKALRGSLRHLYRRLARDGVVFGSGFLLSATVATIGALGPTLSILSDLSFYVIIASLSLALLIVLKED
jgi:hypothetical protein